MAGLLKQSSTAQPLIFLMIDSTDHIAGKTGLSPTVTISKNGGAFASPSGAVTEIGSGWYKVAGNATDTGTLGPLLLHATGTGADPADERYEVVAFDPQTTSMGLSLAKTTNITGFNDIAATAIVSSGAITTSGGAVSTVTTTTTATNVTTVNGLATGVITATSIAADAITDAKVAADVTIASVTGSVGSVTGAVGSVTGSVGSVTGAVGSVTGNVGGNVTGSVGSISGVTFPTNFGVLAITATTGRVTAGTVLDKTGYSLSASQTFDVTGSISGSVGSVTGAVGSVTGNVGGNVTGSVGSISGVTFPTNFSVLAIAATTGQVGLNFDNVKQATGATTLTNITVPTVTTLTNKTGFSLTQTFPTNFADLAITATTGRVTAGTVSDKTGYSLSSSQTFDVTGNRTGNLSGSVGSVTGNVNGNVVGSVGSVTGAVGSVTGAVGSVTGNVGGNVVGSTASVSGSVGSVTGAVGSVTGDVGGKVLGGGSGTITGDGVRAASVTGSVASVTGSVGSVTGSVGGNVSGSVASVTAGVTVTTNNDKTGYRLSATGVDDIWDEVQSGHVTSGTFGAYLDASVSGVSTGGVSANDIAVAVRDIDNSAPAVGSLGATINNVSAPSVSAIWGHTTRTLTAGTNIVLAKGTGITGFNDLSAAQVNTEADTALADVGLTTTVTGRIDAAISTRSTFAGGAVASVTGAVGSISGVTFPTNFSALGINASGHVSRVTLADTVTTYTGNTPQTGDAYARVGAAGAGLTALGDTRLANLDATVSSRAPSSTALSNVVWTNAKAAFIDAAISSVSGGGGGGSVTVAGYAAGQSPADLVLVTPSQKLATDSSGRVTGAANVLDAVSTTLNAAPSTFPQWVLWLALRFRRTRLNKASGALSVYGSNGTTVITTQTTSVTSTDETVSAIE